MGCREQGQCPPELLAGRPPERGQDSRTINGEACAALQRERAAPAPRALLRLCENWSTSFSQDGEGLYTHSSDKEEVKTVAVPGACWENFAF